jgi:prepilin signal peptidase PulO-like enzyme (type II secretory pathway)
MEYIPLLFCLSGCSTADLIAFEIPDGFVLLGLLSGLVVRSLKAGILPVLLWGLLGLLVGVALVLIGDSLYGDWSFGMGDAKALGMLGIWLGSDWLDMFFAAVIGLGLWGLLVVLKNGLEARREVTPFFPFLAVASVSALAGLW